MYVHICPIFVSIACRSSSSSNSSSSGLTTSSSSSTSGSSTYGRTCAVPDLAEPPQIIVAICLDSTMHLHGEEDTYSLTYQKTTWPICTEARCNYCVFPNAPQDDYYTTLASFLTANPTFADDVIIRTADGGVSIDGITTSRFQLSTTAAAGDGKWEVRDIGSCHGSIAGPPLMHTN